MARAAYVPTSSYAEGRHSNHYATEIYVGVHTYLENMFIYIDNEVYLTGIY